MQGHGNRGGRGNYSSRYMSNGGGNRALSAKENGIINKGVEEGNYETTESTNKREFEAYGPIKQDAASRGIVGVGFDVVQYGLASTLGMFNTNGFQFFSNEDFLCPVDGAIMITASHLPYNRNGFKFFPNEGGLGKPDIKDILEHAANIYNGFTPESLEEAERKLSSSTTKVDYMAIYASNLVIAVRKASGKIGNPLEGFHIVVDAGKEAGGFFAVSYLLACVHNSLPRFSSDVQLTHHNKTNIGFAPTNTAILLGTVAHMIPTVIDSDMAMVLSSDLTFIVDDNNGNLEE
ncbi:uncharacterized protein LOC111916095 [Lactuca sativa]|uniref:uncharacterized protein LOC111916095 n=1 Tax=Lactuca sativa TaxID=4236 RepID=UPI000CD90F50|nr:uncharacterized protein LOC111916095 [Lactuca sativa]